MPKKIVEAALFMSPKPITTKELAKITGFPERQVEDKLVELMKDYESENKGVEITRDPEGWGMRVKPGLLPHVAHLTPYSDLKDGHKRTLALVAYKEPIKQSEVIRIQGNKAYAYIKRLEKKGLIRSNREGRTKTLALTQEFERYFGEEKSRIKEMLSQGVNEMEKEDKEREEKEQNRRMEGFKAAIEKSREEQDRMEKELKHSPEEAPKKEEKETLRDRLKRMESKLKAEDEEDPEDDDGEPREDEEDEREEKKKPYSELAEVIPFSDD